MTYTPYFFRRNRDLGTISVLWAIVTSAVYPLHAHAHAHGHAHVHAQAHIYGQNIYYD